MNDAVTNLPIIALRGMTILPYMVIHFDVSRKKSIKSVEYAMKNGQKLFLVTQKSAEIVKPARDEVCDVGTVCEIKQLVKMPGGLVRVLVRGLERAVLGDFTVDDDMLAGNVTVTPNTEFAMPDNERDARISLLKEMMNRYYMETGRNQGENISRVNAISSLDEIVYTSLSECTTEYTQRQEVLDLEDLLMRFDEVCDLVCSEIEVVELKKSLSEELRKRVDRNQKEYILHEQIHAIREELGEEDVDDEVEEFRKAVDALDASDAVKDKIRREIKRYDSVSGSSSESSVIRTYIETMLELPWNKRTDDNYDLKGVQKALDDDHYGLKKVKERIVEFLAVRALNGKGESPIVCLAGPPGTGKTSIAASVAGALNRRYVRVCLGGVRDEAEIRGHRKTYVGAMPGRIVEGLKNAGSGNPLMLLDEIDKAGTDSRGDTASALLEVLDSAQNVSFRDHYIEAPIDLSDVLFIATANDTGSIPKPLLDRMEVIELNSYTATEKFHIAAEHLIHKQLDKNGLTPAQLSFTDDAVRKIIEKYTKEAGVRELERQIGAVCRKAARFIVEGVKTSHKVTVRNLSEYLGSPKYDGEDKPKKDAVGVVKGLAWTSVGGTTLDVEAVVMKGKGGLVLTGKLGDVMKESAQVSLGYIRSVARGYGIKDELFEKNDIHLHVPEGAVPKDGPSAGITITLAMLSALTGRKVSHDTAMTGEITLHGQVLPIGGLKEKLLAASMAGIKNVLIPDKNKKDLAEIETEITEKLNICPVKTMNDVVKAALRQ